MGVVHAGVDDRHRDRGTALEDRPGFRRVDVGVRGGGVQAELAAEGPGEAVERLAGIVESPLLTEVVIARHHLPFPMRGGHGDAADVVRFGVEDVRVVRVERDGGLFVLGLDANAMDTRARDLGDRRSARRFVRGSLCVGVGAWLELHQDLAFDERAPADRLRGGADGQCNRNENERDECLAWAHGQSSGLSDVCRGGNSYSTASNRPARWDGLAKYRPREASSLTTCRPDELRHHQTSIENAGGRPH